MSVQHGAWGVASCNFQPPLSKNPRSAAADLSSPGEAGYVVDFDVYVGSQSVPEEDLTQRVVLELLEPPVSSNLPLPVLGLDYHLYVDDYYTSGMDYILSALM